MSMINSFLVGKGEVDADRANLSGMSMIQNDNMPDEAELKLIGQLREKFKEQLEKRKENGTHWEAYFGDVNMTRIIRGNDGKMEMAEKWFTRFLGILDSTPELKDWVSEAEALGEIDLGGEVFKKYFAVKESTSGLYTFNFSSKLKAANGDLIMYIPSADYEKKKLLALSAEDWNNYVAGFKKTLVLMTILLDKESKKAGRLVKYWGIFDLKYLTLSALMVPEYDKKLDDVYKFLEGTCAEQMRKSALINAPWWIAKMFSAATTFLPERFVAKLMVCEAGDDTLKSIADEATLQAYFATRVGRASGLSAEPKGTIELKAGTDFEYAISAKAGQTVTWKFKASDIGFGGYAFWTDGGEAEDKDEDSGAEVVVPKCTVTESDGEVEGELEIARDGIVNLRWDFYHGNALTSKAQTLTYEVTVK